MKMSDLHSDAQANILNYLDIHPNALSSVIDISNNWLAGEKVEHKIPLVQTTVIDSSIKFCIKHGLKRFNPSTQSEHKIQRSFEPVLTYSYHWIQQPEFKQSIKVYANKRQSKCTSIYCTVKVYYPFIKKNIKRNLSQTNDD